MTTVPSAEVRTRLSALLRRAEAGQILLLAGLVVGLWLAATLFFQPPFGERAGPEALPHLSTDPLPFHEVAWGEEAWGPGAAFAGAEALLLASSVILLLLLGAAGGLGQVAAAGVAAVSRRSELRLRRAVGAPRKRLLDSLIGEALGVLGLALLLGAAVALALGLILGATWATDAAPPGPTFQITWPVLVAVAAALLLWGLFSFAVVQSGEALPGTPLHRDTPLGEPFQGELCHPGVPVLQVAVATVILVSASLLLGEAIPGMAGTEARLDPALERVVLHAPPDRVDGSLAVLLQEIAEFPPGATTRVAVTSPGFWDGVGHVRYAETECGYCFRPGSPPVFAPLKGEFAVHHALSPDTFELAGIALLEGRGFTPGDGPDAEPVAVVSRGFARENFQDGDAVGRRVRLGADRSRWHTVVGVIEPLPRRNLAGRRQPPEDVLVPAAQAPPAHVEVVTEGPGPFRDGGFPGDLRALETAPVSERSRAIDAWGRSFAALWRGSGLAAAVLALLGTGLTVGRRVSEQAPEIALRRALGAPRSRVVLRYLGLGLRLGVLGALVGCWAALFAVAALFPEGFHAPGTLAAVFLPVGLALIAVGGVASAGAAFAALRGSPRERMEG